MKLFWTIKTKKIATGVDIEVVKTKRKNNVRKRQKKQPYFFVSSQK